MSRNKKIVFGAGFVFLFFVVLATAAHAQVSIDFPSSFAGFSSQDLKTTIENIVRIVLGFIGIIFLVLMLYGGFIWMTSGGDEKKIAQAKKIIVSATIGLIITLASYAIASFIVNKMGGATSDGSGTSSSGSGGFGFALGAGVLESHYPGRNATGVPRNTNIFVTFKEQMDVDTICPGANVGVPRQILTTSFEMTDVNRVVSTPDASNAGPDNILEGIDCEPTDAMNKTFKFNPRANLGLNNGTTLYRILLTNNIKSVTGKVPGNYSWKFTVSNIVDLTPPTVLSVIPVDGQTVARNTIVQINFSEAVDPSLASGIAPPFGNITLTAPVPIGQLEGSYISGNQYKTTEFTSNEICGQNSCGMNVYCLPATVTIDGVVTAAIMDMAGNQLDGDNDGSPGGNYIWSFDTDNNIDLSPPVMTSRIPSQGTTGANLFDPVQIPFNELMSASSITTGNAGFSRNPTWPGGLPFDDNLNYWVGKEDVDTNNDGIPDLTRVLIYHDALKPLTDYHPGVDSEIQDLRQNCFLPALCDGSTGPC